MDLTKEIEELIKEIEELKAANKKLMLTIREIYASLSGEAERAKTDAAARITERNVDSGAAERHMQKHHAWRRAASRVQDICLAHGIDYKSAE